MIDIKKLREQAEAALEVQSDQRRELQEVAASQSEGTAQPQAELKIQEDANEILTRQLEESQQNLKIIRSVLSLTEESEDALNEQLETARLVIKMLRDQRNEALYELAGIRAVSDETRAIYINDCEAEINAIEKRGEAT